MGGGNKISWADAVVVWSVIKETDRSLRDIAEAYNLGESTVLRIANGSHPHVQEKGPARILIAREPLREQECALVLGEFWMGWSIEKIHRDTAIGLTTIHRVLDGQHRHNGRPIR